MSEIAEQVKKKLVDRVINRVQQQAGISVKNNVIPLSARERLGTVGGRRQEHMTLGSFNWGSIVGDLLGTAGDIYAGKEIAKAQQKYAQGIAEAEAKKLLAETELALAQAQTAQEQARLVAEQNELQRIVASMQFSGVQKWLLAGAGVLAGVLIIMQFAKKGRR